MDGWPSFRKTLSWGGMVAVAVAHVATRTLELAVYRFDRKRRY